jgi:putative endonuclease
MYYVYVLRGIKANELYYGYTNNLERRINEHNRQKDRELIYYEAYKAESDARYRERQLKRYAQALTSLKRRLKDSLK